LWIVLHKIQLVNLNPSSLTHSKPTIIQLLTTLTYRRPICYAISPILPLAPSLSPKNKHTHTHTHTHSTWCLNFYLFIYLFIFIYIFWHKWIKCWGLFNGLSSEFWPLKCVCHEEGMSNKSFVVQFSTQVFPQLNSHFTDENNSWIGLGFYELKRLWIEFIKSQTQWLLLHYHTTL